MRSRRCRSDANDQDSCAFWTGAVGDLDPRHLQVGRHEAVDPGDGDLLIGRRGEVGREGSEQSFARRGLHAGKGETKHRHERDDDIGREAKRAHQKACPRLT